MNDVLLRSGRVALDSYSLLPAAGGELLVDPIYYPAARPSDAVYEDTPSIQTEVIADRYIRLFVPIPARRLDVIRDAECPDVPDAATSGLRLRPHPATRRHGRRPPDHRVPHARLPRPGGWKARRGRLPHSHRPCLGRARIAGAAAGRRSGAGCARALRAARARESENAEEVGVHVIPFWR